ncbi:MAG: hypothetical protein WC370_05375 [Dehalococcoidales bacterium]|jgi:hypothetical protein
MNTLKGVGTVVCSLLLFLALGIFSLGYMLHSTVLSPGFIAKEMDRVEVAAILDEAIKVDAADKNDISQEMKDTLVDTAATLEPVVKEQLNEASTRIFDYLKGKTKELQLAGILSETVASNDFIITLINDIDIAQLVTDFIAQDDSQKPGGISRDIWDEVTDVLNNLEPQLKAAAADAVSPVNDYIWGKTPDLSLAEVLGNSVLATDFVNELINEVDIAALTKDYISTQLTDAVSQDSDEITRYLDENLDEILTRLEPWLKQQITAAAGPGIDYILGKTRTVNVTVSVAPAVATVKSVLKDAYLAAPPPAVAGMSRAAQEQHFETVFADFSGNLPATFSFDEELLGETRADLSKSLADGEDKLSDVRDNIAKALDDASDPMAQARKYIGYFQTVYWLLIVFMVIMAGLIFLINRDVKSTARTLGIDLLTFGVIDIAGVIIAKVLAPMKFIGGFSDLPVTAQNAINGLYSDVTNIALVFSIGVLLVGAILFTVSFFVKSWPAARE